MFSVSTKKSFKKDFDMSKDGKLLDESKQALRLEARRICRTLKNRGAECYRVHPERRYEGCIWPRVRGTPWNLHTSPVELRERERPVGGTARAYAGRRIQSAGAHPHGHPVRHGVMLSGKPSFFRRIPFLPHAKRHGGGAVIFVSSTHAPPIVGGAFLFAILWFLGSQRENETFSLSASMLRPYKRSITNTKKFSQRPYGC